MGRELLTQCAFVLLIGAGANLFGQTAAPKLKFDVTSVKPVPQERDHELRTDNCRSGGGFLIAGAPLIWSVTYAYRVKEYQIADAPPWLSSFDGTYEIEGKPAAPATEAQCRMMLQSLLEERFGLSVHRESREMTVYFLDVAAKGHKLREGGGVRLNGSVQVTELDKPQWPDGWPMSALAAYLADVTGRPVLDRTRLSGTYGIDLRYAVKDDTERPTIFTAVKEQLGLTLQSGKAPVELLVIDRIRRPDAN